jgi:hypothetical protein
MENVHLLPTDKPSRLRYFSGKLELMYLIPKKSDIIFQNIYITSEEEIKVGDGSWIIDLRTNKIAKNINNHIKVWNENCKKIILTTDQDLIKDGVQAIDDEFLEWFVKNPNCEYVEIANDLKYFNVDELRERHLKGLPHLYSESIGYKIIFQKEEPKQYEKNPEFYGSGIFNKVIEPKQETLEDSIYQAIGLAANEQGIINQALATSKVMDVLKKQIYETRNT